VSLSIRRTADRNEELLAQAKKDWESLAQDLAELIPVSMMIYARQKGWIKNDVDRWWTMSKFLQDLITNTKAGGCCSQKIKDTDLRHYGFASFQELEAGINDLSRAWDGLVRISIHTDEVTWEVFFYADEYCDNMMCKEGA
jgi:hypothetical protein